jgi:hypothetical protein
MKTKKKTTRGSGLPKNHNVFHDTKMIELHIPADDPNLQSSVPIVVCSTATHSHFVHIGQVEGTIDKKGATKSHKDAKNHTFELFSHHISSQKFFLRFLLFEKTFFLSFLLFIFWQLNEKEK